MPITPESIMGAIRKSEEPPKKGEEGILHKIELPGKEKRLYAKEWRGKHFEGPDTNPQSYAYEDGLERSPASPYWFKVKYYEGALLHEAFPDSTLRVQAGFDPRISKKDDGRHHFDHAKGRPVTVTEEIKSGSELEKKRDEIIDSAYEKYFSEIKPDERGILKVQSPGVHLHIANADAEIAKALGNEFVGQSVEWENPTKTLQKWEEAVKRVNPKSPLIEFFQNGLLPTHPTFNFIPTQKTERGVEGVFIEVKILDPELLRKKLLERDSSPDHRQRIHRKMERYLLYKMLDDTYDMLFLPQHHKNPPPLVDDGDITNRVFQVLETARVEIEAGRVPNGASFIKKLRGDLYWMFQDHPEKEVFLHELAKREEALKQGGST